MDSFPLDRQLQFACQPRPRLKDYILSRTSAKSIERATDKASAADNFRAIQLAGFSLGVLSPSEFQKDDYKRNANYDAAFGGPNARLHA